MKKEFIQEALTKLRACRTYSEIKDVRELFKSSSELIYYLSYLIQPSLSAKQAYEKEIIEMEAQGKSHASAETHAKAGENYKKYKYLDALYGLLLEQVKLTKKFGQLLNDEQKNV